MTRGGDVYAGIWGVSRGMGTRPCVLVWSHAIARARARPPRAFWLLWARRVAARRRHRGVGSRGAYIRDRETRHSFCLFWYLWYAAPVRGGGAGVNNNSLMSFVSAYFNFWLTTIH